MYITQNTTLYKISTLSGISPKNRKCSLQIFWAIPASVSQTGLISDPLMVSEFHNGIHDPKGLENVIYTK